MTTHHPISNATDSPLHVGDGLGVRSKLTKRQIEVTMFAAGVEKLEGLKVGKLIEKTSNEDFQKALEYVLEKNKELYERLAKE